MRVLKVTPEASLAGPTHTKVSPGFDRPASALAVCRMLSSTSCQQPSQGAHRGSTCCACAGITASTNHTPASHPVFIAASVSWGSEPHVDSGRNPRACQVYGIEPFETPLEPGRRPHVATLD